jgi:hypothetical protein
MTALSASMKWLVAPVTDAYSSTLSKPLPKKRFLTLEGMRH